MYFIIINVGIHAEINSVLVKNKSINWNSNRNSKNKPINWPEPFTKYTVKNHVSATSTPSEILYSNTVKGKVPTQPLSCHTFSRNVLRRGSFCTINVAISCNLKMSPPL